MPVAAPGPEPTGAPDGPRPSIDLRVLGPLRVLVDGVDLHLGGARQRAVLGALATTPNRVVSTAAIIDAVWEEDPPPTAVAAVQVHISALRKTLMASGVADCLHTMSPGYRLTLDQSSYDLARFRQARLDGERRAAAAPADAVSAYDRGLAEWVGPVLADLRGLRFADAFAVSVEEERLAVIHARVQLELRRHHYAEVVPELVSLTSEYPDRQGFWIQLISALYLSGRQYEALAACALVKKRLREELGLDASPEVLRLEQAILRNDELPGIVATPASPDVLHERTVRDSQAAVRRAGLRRADGTVHHIEAGRLQVGRVPDNDLVLADDKVSRRHAVVVEINDGFVVSDTGSLNGTWVDGRRIAGPTEITNGQELRIGDSTFTFVVYDTEIGR